MDSTERFFFDLNGFLVVRGALSPGEVARANEAVDVSDAQDFSASTRFGGECQLMDIIAPTKQILVFLLLSSTSSS